MGTWELPSSSAMRGNHYYSGRCPPFLVAGLVLACVLLLYNYWSLSLQNYELVKQVELLQEELKLVSGRQVECERQHEALHTRLRDAEDEMGKLQVMANKRDEEVKEASRQVQKKEGDVSSLKNDLENVRQEAQNCREEIKNMETSVATKDELIAKLQSNTEKFMKEKHNSVKEAKEKEKQLLAVIEQLKEDKQNQDLQSGNLVANGQEMNSPLESLLPVSPIPGRRGSSTGKVLKHVYVQSKGLKGMKWHEDLPILVLDPPGVPRPPPRFSVADLAAGKQGGGPGDKPVTSDPKAKAQLDAAEDRERQHKLVLERPGKKEEAAPGEKKTEKDAVLEVPKQQKTPDNNLDTMEDDIDPSRLGEDADQNGDGSLDEIQGAGAAAGQGAAGPGADPGAGVVPAPVEGAGVGPAPGVLSAADKDALDVMARNLENQQEPNNEP